MAPTSAPSRTSPTRQQYSAAPTPTPDVVAALMGVLGRAGMIPKNDKDDTT
ncbi:hypothetical protein OG887_43225 (plasmid) [Streptomyces sp. NBC_00053]|uniref:hypothetical protein n=1 Tax=unclassified Streptomyces TaxID=2593676 RepID=UPI0022546CB6|nr:MULTISPECIES: hypothetical protein [unclassified Streptomyces]MCX4400080.1 hypothetical protein [Streptomyces sp. NBC_01767]MCX5106704.1 hypothetical protein [Streptomyces sp. NBC_00439]MCX5106765.1 hypothetical protein [Streptomyces sp. NBC_00439]MCX5506126.1 hypothetical protein [Streptomyces sp. NBC_00052]MCX5554171.1 hypothetical protein [Streptomyces sp. NBC_00051]